VALLILTTLGRLALARVAVRLAATRFSSPTPASENRWPYVRRTNVASAWPKRFRKYGAVRSSLQGLTSTVGGTTIGSPGIAVDGQGSTPSAMSLTPDDRAFFAQLLAPLAMMASNSPSGSGGMSRDEASRIVEDLLLGRLRTAGRLAFQ
jgi:hypothetical protein